jgi:hypothetical protein
MAASYFWLVGVRRGYKFLQNSHGHFIATADTNWILEKFTTIEGEAMVLQGALCEAVIRGWSNVVFESVSKIAVDAISAYQNVELSCELRD